MKEESLLIKIREGIGTVRLNRPEKRNALNTTLILSLTKAFRQLEEDPAVKVIVLEAAGNVFSAGADLEHLKILQQNSYEENLVDSERLSILYHTIYSSNKIILGKAEGHAIAGGCGLLTVCDIVFAVPEAKFGYTEVKIGFLPALVACFLPQRIGAARTRELLLSGELIDASIALQYGLINFIASGEEISGLVDRYAARLAAETSVTSVAATKKLLRKIATGSLEEHLDYAVIANAESRFTKDFEQGISRFLDKAGRHD